MYIGYFVVFLGCAMLTRSMVLLELVLVFQLSAHWIILAEERWCLAEMGELYMEYAQRVRRYLSYISIGSNKDKKTKND